MHICGAFGCDSYDISGTVGNRSSNGALQGLTKFSMENAPPTYILFRIYIPGLQQQTSSLKIF